MRIFWCCWLLAALPASAVAETLKGRLEWAHTVDMRFIEDGVVEEVPVLEGQFIKQGEVLAELDRRDFELSVKEAEAQVTRSEAKLARAERQLEWALELYDRGLISDNERLEAEEGEAEARAAFESAEAGREKAKIALERSVLKSPFDGIVVERRTWPGHVVVKGLQSAPLLVVADGKRMVARGRLTADRMQLLRPGMPAQVGLGPNRVRKGYIYRLGVVSEDISDRGAIYAVDVIFPITEEDGLRPGQFAQIQLGVD